MANDAVVEKSKYPFDETVARLIKAIADAGNILFADIDQRAAAKSVGLVLRPTRLLIFGNPMAGTSLMDAFPLVALDLPLKILVWEEHGETSVAYTIAGAIAARYEVRGKDVQMAGIARTLAAIAASSTTL